MRYYGLTKIGGRVARRNGWFDSPIESFARELCANGGAVRNYQRELGGIGSRAIAKINTLLTLPESPERERLLSEYRDIRDDAKEMSDYLYDVQMAGSDAGLDECTKFFWGDNPRLNPRPNAWPMVVGSVVTVSAVAGLVYALTQKESAADRGYATHMDAQVEYMKDMCGRSKTDPSYRQACEDASKRLAELPPPPQQESPLAPFVPYIVLGFAVLVGYRVVVNRLSARDEPKRDEPRGF